MRNLICLFLAAILPLPAVPEASVAEPPELLALSAVLMAEDGELLYEREADRMLPIASTTKLMTALVVIENCDPEDVVDILPEYCGIEGSSLYLKPGERYTVRELLLGLLLVSGNDAAIALACHCCGDIENFCALMNERAKELGMRSSHFYNPHGLNEAGHYSTARDLAILMHAAMENERFAALISLKHAVVGNQTLINHNKLLQRCPGCIGGKTGYTEVAGRCLVSCVERDDLRLVCVTLNDPDDWNDHVSLYDWAYANYRLLVINEDNTGFEIPLLGGSTAKAHAVPDSEIKLLLPVSCDLIWNTELPFYVFAPVSRGSEAGVLFLQDDGKTLCAIPLKYTEDYPVRSETVWQNDCKKS